MHSYTVSFFRVCVCVAPSTRAWNYLDPSARSFTLITPPPILPFHTGKAGLNRSVTTAAAFLILHRVVDSWDKAIELIKRKRRAVAAGNGPGVPAPHPHWWQQFGQPFVESHAGKGQYRKEVLEKL